MNWWLGSYFALMLILWCRRTKIFVVVSCPEILSCRATLHTVLFVKLYFVLWDILAPPRVLVQKCNVWFLLVEAIKDITQGLGLRLLGLLNLIDTLVLSWCRNTCYLWQSDFSVSICHVLFHRNRVKYRRWLLLRINCDMNLYLISISYIDFCYFQF